MVFSLIITLFYLFYSFLLLTICTLSGLDIYLYLVFPSTHSRATSDVCLTSLLVTLLVHTPTFLGSDIGWTCIRTPPIRLRFPIHRTISHAVRAPLFVLMPSGLARTCPLVSPWFNMTKCVTLAYMSLPRSASHYRPTPPSHVDSAGR